MGGGPWRNGGGDFFTLEKSKFSRFFKLENFQKMLKKQWKIYNFEKNFKFTYKNLNGKLIFTHFLSHLPFYTPLEHTKFFGVGLGVVPPGLGVLSIFFGGGLGAV